VTAFGRKASTPKYREINIASVAEIKNICVFA